MGEFNSYIFINYSLQMTECLTISRLSINLFLKNYYLNNDSNKDKKIPLINKSDVFNFIVKGYYGGVTEVYKPYGKNLYYFDVNSLYPFASLNLIPSTECKYIEDFSGEGLILNNLFGFFYCKVKTSDTYLGLLPVHLNGNLIYPERVKCYFFMLVIEKSFFLFDKRHYLY